MLDSAFASAPSAVKSTKRSLEDEALLEKEAREERSYAPRCAVEDEKKEGDINGRWSPSGYSIRPERQDTARTHPTTMIVHPRYPLGSAHFVHPNPHLRPSVSVQVPGLPFEMVVAQKHDGVNDSTGFAVWRGAVVLSAYLISSVAPSMGRARSIELGCGTGAIVSSVASWMGFVAHATDRPNLISAARKSYQAHRNAALSAGAPMLGPPLEIRPLEWGRQAAAAYADKHGRFDLVLGSEIIYALIGTNDEHAIQTFRSLVATIDALLAPGGIALLAWSPRSHVETYFFATLPEFHLVASSPLPINDLGLPQTQTHGLNVISVSRQVAV